MLLMVYLQDFVDFQLRSTDLLYSMFALRRPHLEFLRIYSEAELELHVLQQFEQLLLLSKWTLLLQIVQLPLSLCSTYNLHLAHIRKNNDICFAMTLPSRCVSSYYLTIILTSAC